MSKPYRVYCSAGYNSYFAALQSNPNFVQVGSIKDADVVLFAGGEDINPELYGHKSNPHTYFSRHRDAIEVQDWNYAREHGLKILGICRGLQFMCAMSGGKLFQHVTMHNRGGHGMFLHHPAFEANEPVQVTSAHHQMINPFNLQPEQYRIFATAPALSTTYESETHDSAPLGSVIEIEACGFPETNAFGVQYHPEWMQPGSDGQVFFQHLSLALCNGTLFN